MRTGGCTVQQALTPEAAVVVKQAVSLARRRGNAQVTPLHVASAMLQHQSPSPSSSSTTGLLRAACLRSHSHPLQCKALELCFNVALNRLPSSASPLLVGGHGGHVYYPPSLSNALVAAFKRAQAHQRRGSVETQNQPVLAVKIELEQLVISILDDPSVSRVMREAGFSSSHVKANVEHAVVSSSIEANTSASTTTAAAAASQNPNPSAAAPFEETKPSKLLCMDQQVREEDVAAILECLASRRKRRVMVVAESAAAAEAATRAAVDKIKRGGGETAMRGAQVVSVGVSVFRDMARSEAERRLAELRCAVVKAGQGRVVLVVEDLGWVAEFWAARRGEAAAVGRGRWASTSSCCGGYYCAVEHAVAEVRALACRGGDGVWLVGYGTYQSYMRCRAGEPSLESIWGLQTLAVPAGSLALSLNYVDDSSAMAVSHLSSRPKCEGSSGNGSVSRCMSLLDAGGSGQPTAVVSACCGGCSDTKCSATKELARSLLPPSSIPPWLQHCRNNQEPSHCKKRSLTCSDTPSHSHHRTPVNLSTVVSPSSSVSSYEHHYHLHQPYQPWLVAEALDAKHPWTTKARCGAAGPVHIVVDDEDVKLVSAVKVKSHDSSASNGSVEQVECRSKFKELSAENLKILCSALEKEVPWQVELAPEIASTVLQCRSGMARRRRDVDVPSSRPVGPNEDTWLLFLGSDVEGKVRVARELGRLVFGSHKSFVSVGTTIASSSSSPARSDSTEHHRKRPRSLPETSNNNGGCLERLYVAVRDNPHRVIMVEDVEQAGCQKGILEAIDRGFFRSHGGDVADLGDAIIILSCESFDARSRTSSPPTTKKAKSESEEELKAEEGTGDHRHKEVVTATGVSPSSSCFDLNMSVENDDMEEMSRFTDAGLLKAVDRAFFFKRPEESSD